MFLLTQEAWSHGGRSQETTFPSSTTTTVLPVVCKARTSIPVSTINRGSPDVRSRTLTIGPSSCATAASDLSGENSKRKQEGAGVLGAERVGPSVGQR